MDMEYSQNVSILPDTHREGVLENLEEGGSLRSPTIDIKRSIS